MKKQIKELRVKIDGLAQLSESITSKNNRSVWVLECHKSLLLAKAWLGKVLAELGEETPYKNDGKRRKAEDIEPTADAAVNIEDFPFAPDRWGDEISNVPYIEKIDFLREEINNTIRLLDKVWEGKSVLSDDELTSYLMGDGLTFLGNSEHCLMEARFHLGFELQRIKELNEK